MSDDDGIMLFERRLVRRHRERAAAQLAQFRFLFDEVGERLLERLAAVRRVFPRVLVLGGQDGTLARALQRLPGTALVVNADLAPALARRARADGLAALAADEELLPFAPHSFDLVLCPLSLHWVNDLPGALAQLRRVLVPDGLMLAALLGGATLTELRQALVEAELALCGGAAPRVSPFATLADAAGLLQRIGFALPVADSDRLTVTYPHLLRLLADLRGMGETNALSRRHRVPARRALFAAAAEHYHQRFAEPDGRLPATFEVLWLTGWSPAGAAR